jgi:hypothetical protein
VDFCASGVPEFEHAGDLDSIVVRWDRPGYARLGIISHQEGQIEWLQDVPTQEVVETADGTVETGKYGAHFDNLPSDSNYVVGLWFPDGRAAGLQVIGENDWPVEPHEAGVSLQDLTSGELVR